jgi:phosphatidate phosphatase PAH1
MSRSKRHEIAHGETANIKLSNEDAEMTPAANFEASEEEARRSAQAKKDAEEKAEEEAKELRKANERLARVRNGQGYIKYNLDGSKYMAGKQGVEQVKIKYLGEGWACGKMILVELGEDCEYIVPTPGIGDRGI